MVAENKPRKSKDEFTAKVSNYGSSGRKHIEIPKPNRPNFESGDMVFVEKLDLKKLKSGKTRR